MRAHYILFVMVLLLASQVNGQTKTITFPSSDGLEITADLYTPHSSGAPFIVLFHQANWSRGEYKETAPKLNELGYNCMAVDLRSGGKVGGVVNETNRLAKEKELDTDYIDSYPDMIAAIKYVKNQNLARGKLIVLGSSYSAALVIPLAVDYPNIIDGVVSFSPGEYFSKQGKPKTYVSDNAKKLKVPLFIASAKKEDSYWLGIFQKVPGNNKAAFIPETGGNHGSRALWEKFPDSGGYWDALKSFLKEYFK